MRLLRLCRTVRSPFLPIPVTVQPGGDDTHGAAVVARLWSAIQVKKVAGTGLGRVRPPLLEPDGVERAPRFRTCVLARASDGLAESCRNEPGLRRLQPTSSLEDQVEDEAGADHGKEG